MTNWIKKVILWLLSLWSALPKKTKDKIIDIIVERFSALFRAFYRSQKRYN
jgi:hypothetical protein